MKRAEYEAACRRIGITPMTPELSKEMARLGIAVKGRGILFSAPMVRALLAGTKTQTRRPVKNLSRAYPGTVFMRESFPEDAPWWPYATDSDDSAVCSDGNERPMKAPYGEPGGFVWVRETWARDDADAQLVYRADVGQGGAADDWDIQRRDGVPGYRWIPAIHMPRQASRINLHVAAVRCERLQDISEEDCIAEGIEQAGPHGYGWKKYTDPGVVCSTARQSYSSLWDSINGAGSWDANPWVWVISFTNINSIT